MIRKFFAQDPVLLKDALIILFRAKVLIDYAAPVYESDGISQIVRVKCDDTTLNNLVKRMFKKRIAILK